jgi:4-amino-4-deoxy-L-arabinose transferase-like glycosyltransferase
LALATLAKGPVAPVLSAVIILLFLAIKRQWPSVLGSLWIPGIALYCAVMLPWYIAVQLRNPGFFRFFVLEHNLARFSQDVYHHHQPFWFYLPVFLLAMMPWSVVLVLALSERARLIWSEGKEAFSSAEDSWPLFVLLWMLVPVLFFSASQSKLPGYILPAVPAGALLVTEYLAARRSQAERCSIPFAAGHGVVCGLLVFAALSAGSIAMHRHFQWGTAWFAALALAAVFAAGIAWALRSRAGIYLLSRITTLAVVVSVFLIIRLAAPVIDAGQSARPIAESIQTFSREPASVALYHLSRIQEYGLEFYLNRPAKPYEGGTVPVGPHVVVAAQGTQRQVAQLVPGRRVSYLTSIPAQKVDLYWVGKEKP